MRARFNRLIDYLASAVCLPDDSREDRLRKSVLAFLAAIWAVVGFIWGCTYLAFGLPLSASIPLAYAAFSAAGLVIFLRTRRYVLFLTLQLILVSLLPFCLQMTLGGYRASGAVVVWSVMAPLAALIFEESRHAVRWFAVYAVLLTLAGVLDPLVSQHGSRLPAWAATASFVIDLAEVTGIFFFIILYSLRQRAKMQAAIEMEQARSEALLLNILPPSIAARLKDGETLIADAHAEVTVVFADIVGFTPLSASLPPDAVVGMLNQLYSAFDDLADRCGLEKIHTVGDCYFAVAGAPVARPDHAQAAAEFAMALLQVVRSHPSASPASLNMRIGLNSGPVVAGVIGKRKFIYDLYGDTVNTGSRMESEGIPGEIQASEATYLRLRDTHAFDLRGTIEVKGKGRMTTYLLRGQKADLPPASLGAVSASG